MCSDGLHTSVEYVLEKKGNCSVLRHNPSTSYKVYKKWRSTNGLLSFSTNERVCMGDVSLYMFGVYAVMSQMVENWLLVGKQQMDQMRVATHAA